jgi:hypothetical protein
MTMETEGEFGYAVMDGYRVAELPYGQGNYSMLIFLPDQDVGVDGMIDGSWIRRNGTVCPRPWIASIN